MNEIRKVFVENGMNHEKSDFSDFSFVGLDYSIRDDEVSFYRSNFSGVTINDCVFFKNAFGRSDFIGASITKSEFRSVNFGSCLFKHTFFEETIFQNNKYSGVAIQYSYFTKCTFQNETITTNMYYSEFSDCRFINCIFNKSSLDQNTFKNCELINVDLSECTADNLRFDCCSLSDVFLDEEMWLTYLFKNTNIEGLALKKRGDVIPLNKIEFNGILNKSWERGMFFEYLNIMLLFNQETYLFQTMQTIMPIVSGQKQLVRKNNISKILKMLLFYCNSNRLTLSSFLRLYEYLSEYNWQSFSFEERTEYLSYLFKMSEIINNCLFDVDYINSIPNNELAIEKMHISSNKKDEAVDYLTCLFEIANHDLCGNNYEKPYYTVLQEETGSVILTILSYTSLILFISYAAKAVFHNILSIKVEHKLAKQLTQIADKANTTKALDNLIKSAESLKYTNFKDNEKTMKKLMSAISKDEIIDIAISLLLPK